MNGMGDHRKQLQWLHLLKVLLDGYTSVSQLYRAEREALSHVLITTEAGAAAFYAELHEAQQAASNVQAMVWIYDHKDAIL